MAKALFKVGDVVQLKSGSVPMTVSGKEGGNVDCSWFTTKGDLKSARFAAEMLKEASPPWTLEDLAIDI